MILFLKSWIRSLVSKWIKTTDKESFVLARKMILIEGILCGGSSGSAVYAGLQEAKKIKKRTKLCNHLA